MGANWFDTILQFFQSSYAEYGYYGYLVLFFGVMLENAGVPLPGETAVLVAGYMASKNDGVFRVEIVIGVTLIAAILGDNIGFWLGYRFARPRLERGQRFLFLTPRAYRLAQNYFESYGAWTIFTARFITGLRVVGALAAGTAGMKWRRFLLANASGALAWAVTMTFLGYFAGKSLSLLLEWVGRSGWILLGGFVVVIVLVYYFHRKRRRMNK